MPIQLVGVGDVEQRVEQAGVAQVDPRRTDLAFPQVLHPGRQHANEKGPGQEVEIAARGGLARSQRPREFGGVPDLSVPVRDHHPEAPQRLGGDADAQGRQIPLQEGGDELLAPTDGAGVVRGEEGTRKTAAQPQIRPPLRAGLAEVETGEGHRAHPSGERLGDSPHQSGRGAAGQQESRAVPGAVHQPAQDVQETGIALDLVEHDQPGAVAERPLRRLQAPPVQRPLEIEGVRRPRGPGELGRRRRLAALPRPEDRHHGMHLERLPDAGCDTGSGNQLSAILNPCIERALDEWRADM